MNICDFLKVYNVLGVAIVFTRPWRQKVTAFN